MNTTKEADGKSLLESLSGGETALALAVLPMVVPFGTSQLTVATTVNVAVSPLAMLSFSQLIVPAVPTAGTVQVQSGGAETDTKPAPGGTSSVKVTWAAEAGPLSVTVTVTQRR